jgi:hypothetical protein
VAYSIEQLKNVIGSNDGVALGNLFRVILPAQEQAKNLDLLCRSTNMPGRSILTNERLIGLTKQTVAYGYEKPNVTMTFLVLNNPFVRTFFEQWMNLVVDNKTYQLGYYSDYTRNINIQQLMKKTTVEGLAQKISNNKAEQATNAGNKSDINQEYSVVYNCLLEDAYPVTMTGPSYSDQPDQLVEISVDFVYKNWREVNSSSASTFESTEQQRQRNLLVNSKPQRSRRGPGI